MRSSVPQGWQIAHLGNVATVLLSNVDKKSKEDEPKVKLCNYMDVYSNDCITSTIDFMTATASQAQIEKFGLKPGDVMITKDSEDPTDIAIPSVVLEEFDEPVLCGYHLALLRPQKAVDGHFLAYALRSKDVNDQFVRGANGSTRFGLTSNVIHKATLPVPPLAEQRKIAAILTSVDEAIQATEAVIAQTRRVKEGLLQELLTKGIGHTRFKQTEIGNIPETWEVVTLTDVAKIIDCKHRTPEYSDQGYPVVRPGDITNGPLRLAGCLRVSKSEYLDLAEKHRPKPGDIVYSRNQNYGISAIVETQEEFAIGQDVCLIHAEKLMPHFLHFVLSSNLVWNQIRKIMAGSTFKRINLGDIRKLRVPLLKETEQREIEKKLVAMDLLLEKSGRYKSGLQQLKSGLLQDLLTGRVRVTP